MGFLAWGRLSIPRRSAACSPIPNAVMIRRVTGRSLSLVKAYLELYRRYDQPDYHFRLSQLRNAFTREDLGEKRGPRSRSRTGGAGR